MKTRFIACSACARHVRADEGACPFCGAAVPTAKLLRTVKGRLSRAAMHAAGAAGAVVAMADCSSNGPNGNVFYGAPCVEGQCGVWVADASVADAADANTAVFYGAACPDGSCTPPVEAGTDAPAEAGADGPADAGPADGAGDVRDDGPADAPSDSNGTD